MERAWRAAGTAGCPWQRRLYSNQADPHHSQQGAMPEQHWFLKNCDLFERLTSAELSQLESRAKVRQFPRRSAVYLPADQADAVLLLVSGRVKIGSLTTGGKESILAFIEPGELFGELAIFDAGRRE